MEKTKLTIRLPRDLLEGAKRYAREHNTTLTRMVSAYLRQVSTEDDPLFDAPTVRRLSGILPQSASVQEYRAYLEHKHDCPT
jgi:hypothetical protein